MPEINWYPGHMAQAKRRLTQLLKYLDLLLEVRDARLPTISHNQDLEDLLRRRPRWIILTKADLADPNLTKQWLAWWQGQGQTVLLVNGQTGQGIKELWSRLDRELGSKTKSHPLKIGVVGIPNVGKSSLLNRLLGSSSARTGNRPGVTRGQQWVRRQNFEILDTPGLLPPRIQNRSAALRLAWIGTIRDTILPVYDLALALLEEYGSDLKLGPKSAGPGATTEEQLGEFARSRGCLLKAGQLDWERAANTLLREFRQGRLGRISLEVPPTAGLDG